VARSELVGSQIVEVPLGETRLDFEMVDKSNDNSALVSYFQKGLIDGEDVKSAKLMEMINHFLD